MSYTDRQRSRSVTVVERSDPFERLLDIIPLIAVIRALSSQGGGSVDITPIVNKLNEIGVKVDNASNTLNELWQYLRTLKMEKVITYIWAPGVVELRDDVYNVFVDYAVSSIDSHQNVLNMNASIEFVQVESEGGGA